MNTRPLSPTEIRELGYEIQANGSWRLVRAEARPAPRPGLCRGCQKFDAMFDGLCAGCVYFGIADPHGINTECRPVPPDEVPDLLRELTPRERFRARLRARASGKDPDA